MWQRIPLPDDQMETVSGGEYSLYAGCGNDGDDSDDNDEEDDDHHYDDGDVHI